MTISAYTVRNSDFIEKIDVTCPKCAQRATVIGASADAPVTRYEQQVRFSCAACGYAVKYGNTPKFAAFVNSKGRAVRGRRLLLNTPCDPFFGFRVWYLIETPHGTLWAYNREHLTVIEQYIANHKNEPSGLPIKKNSLASRLQPWVTDAKYRKSILKLIRRCKG